MNAIRAVLGKELLDNFRDRRALLTALLLGPLLGPLLLGLLVVLFSVQLSPADPAKTTMPVAGAEHAPALMQFLAGYGVVPEAVDTTDHEAAVRSGELDYLVVVPEDFNARLAAGETVAIRVLVDGSRTRIQPQRQRVTRLIEAWGEQVAAQRLMVRGLSAELREPLRLQQEDVSTARQRSALLLAFLPYSLVFGILMGGFYLAIDVTAGERERGTLEALLAAPVQRGALVLGKWLAVVCFSGFALLLAVAVFLLGLERLPWASLGLAPHFGVSTALVTLVIYVPLVLLAAAVLMLVASFTRSFKEAQSWLSVLAIAPMAPLVVHFVSPLESSYALMLAPVAAQHVLALELLRGDGVIFSHALLATLAALAWTVLALVLSMRLYARERLLNVGQT